MRDTITVVQAFGKVFTFTSINFLVNYIGIPLLFGWLGYKLKDYLNKIEMERIHKSEEELKQEVSSLKGKLEQVKLEKAREESEHINLEMEIQKIRGGLGKQ